MELVEQLGLQDPFFLLAASAEAVDPIAQRAVRLAVQQLDDAGGKLFVGRRPRHALVEVHEMALVDPGRRRIDDHEHLRGEVFAAAVEDDAGNANRPRVSRVILLVKVQGGQAVLTVNDQIVPAGLFQVPDLLKSANPFELKPLRREQQNGAWNRRLAHRGFVEVRDRPHLGAGQLPLEGLVGALDLSDKSGDLVLFRRLDRGDLLALPIKPAHEADFPQEVLRGIRDEVEDPVFLANLCGKHDLVCLPKIH